MAAIRLCKICRSIISIGCWPIRLDKSNRGIKVIENTQRDINIGLINELSVLFHKLGIDTQAVLDAAGSKWNFLKFSPGLVGGHCIGVDPFYLTYKAAQLGHQTELILAGRRINDNMADFVFDELMKNMIKNGLVHNKCKVLILGVI